MHKFATVHASQFHYILITVIRATIRHAASQIDLVPVRADVMIEDCKPCASTAAAVSFKEIALVAPSSALAIKHRIKHMRILYKLTAGTKAV